MHKNISTLVQRTIGVGQWFFRDRGENVGWYWNRYSYLKLQ